jgi:threonine aldolase
VIERKVWRSFASDNYAGVHPEILEAMASVNDGHERAYGADAVTDELLSVVKQEFGEQATVYPVFNGTGANVVSLSAATRRWEAVICAATAHINTDEGGAPEKMAGLKLWTVETPDGKLTPELIETQCFDFDFVHRAQQAVVSITQTTEMGTLFGRRNSRHCRNRPQARALFAHGWRPPVERRRRSWRNLQAIHNRCRR